MPLRDPIEKLKGQPPIELGFDNLRYLVGGEGWDEGFEVGAVVPVMVFTKDIADSADWDRRRWVIVVFGGDWRVELGWKGGESEAPQMGDGVLEKSEKWGFEEIAGGGGEGFFHYHWSKQEMGFWGVSVVCH